MLLHLEMEYKKRKTRGKHPVFQPAQAVQGINVVLVFHRVYIEYLMECIESSIVIWQMSIFLLNVQIWIIHKNFWVCPKLNLNTIASSWKKRDRQLWLILVLKQQYRHSNTNASLVLFDLEGHLRHSIVLLTSFWLLWATSEHMHRAFGLPTAQTEKQYAIGLKHSFF